MRYILFLMFSSKQLTIKTENNLIKRVQLYNDSYAKSILVERNLGLVNWAYNKYSDGFHDTFYKSIIKNSKDEVISGSLNQVQKITDIWTFAKNKNSKNPNWLLVATSD